ncbi:MAG: hypothetical protein PVJ39_10630 [Gammaproteobacteria bacterium]|jgi:hypothetical protein
MIEVLTYLVGGVSALAVILMTILVYQIYDENHPLNHDRPEENTRID